MKIMRYNVVWEDKPKTRKPRARFIVPLPPKEPGTKKTPLDRGFSKQASEMDEEEYKAYRKNRNHEYYRHNVEKILKNNNDKYAQRKIQKIIINEMSAILNILQGVPPL